MGAAAPRRRSVPGTPGQLYEALRDAAEEDSTGRAVSTTSLMRGMHVGTFRREWQEEGQGKEDIKFL